MNLTGEVDWHQLFVTTVPLPETLVRGSAVYLAIFVLLRFFARRESSYVGVTDLLLVVLIADAAQNAMADYTSITDGLLLVATIVFWDYFLDWLGYRSAWAGRLIKARKLLLVEDGRVVERNMKRELVTMEELESGIRKQGVKSVEEVERAYMEPDRGYQRYQEKRGKGPAGVAGITRPTFFYRSPRRGRLCRPGEPVGCVRLTTATTARVAGTSISTPTTVACAAPGKQHAIRANFPRLSGCQPP